MTNIAPHGMTPNPDEQPNAESSVSEPRDHLAELQTQLAVVRDRIGGVVLRHHTGLCLSGPKGTGKTYTVKDTLDDYGQPYFYHAGHLTPMGLFDLLAEQHDQVIVLDDIVEILKKDVARQFLLAAVGTQPDSPRVVKYRRQGLNTTVEFTGRLILISNLDWCSNPLLDAIKSRLHYFWYNPTDAQLAALMRNIATRGWPTNTPVLSAAECLQVAKYLIAKSGELGCHLDLRLLVDKAFPDFLQHKNGNTECHSTPLTLFCTF